LSRLDLCGCNTREGRNDLRNPPDDPGQLDGNPVEIRGEWGISGDQLPVSTHLHPLAVTSQVKEAEVLVLEYEPPIEKGPCATYAPGEPPAPKHYPMFPSFPLDLVLPVIKRVAGEWDLLVKLCFDDCFFNMC